MKCKKCGAIVNDEYIFCNVCGAKMDKNNTQTTEEIASVNDIKDEQNNKNVFFNINEVDIPIEEKQREQKNNIEPELKQNRILPEELKINVEKKQKKKINIDFSSILNNNPLLLICLILVLIIIDIVVFSVRKPTFKSSDTNINQVTIKSDKNVDYKGYRFTIPSSNEYQIQASSLTIMNYANSSIMKLDLGLDSSYDTLKSDLNLFKEDIVNDNYKCNNAAVKTIDDIEYIIYEIEQNNQKLLLGFTKLPINKNYMIEFVIYNVMKGYDYDFLTSLSSIIKNIKTSSVQSPDLNMEVKLTDNKDFYKNIIEKEWHD